jgi:hypothetical protein
MPTAMEIRQTMRLEVGFDQRLRRSDLFTNAHIAQARLPPPLADLVLLHRYGDITVG